MHRLFLCPLLLLLTLWPAAPPRETESSMSDILIGRGQKVWVYGGYNEGFMNDGECSGSETWKFYSDKTFVAKRCRGTSVVTEERTWEVKEQSSGLFNLIITGKQVCTEDPENAPYASEEKFDLSILLESGKRRLTLTRKQRKGVEMNGCFYKRRLDKDGY